MKKFEIEFDRTINLLEVSLQSIMKIPCTCRPDVCKTNCEVIQAWELVYKARKLLRCKKEELNGRGKWYTNQILDSKINQAKVYHEMYNASVRQNSKLERKLAEAKLEFSRLKEKLLAERELREKLMGGRRK